MERGRYRYVRFLTGIQKKRFALFVVSWMSLKDKNSQGLTSLFWECRLYTCGGRKMTKKLTKRQAIVICKELWEWLYKECGGEVVQSLWVLKKSWPGWKKYGVLKNDCPCCEYCGGSMGSSKCEKCPLIKLWPLGCCDTDSCYTLAKYHTGRDRLRYIMEIIDYCNKLLRVRKCTTKKSK